MMPRSIAVQWVESDPWNVLGLDRGASASDVNAAYRRLAEIYHPDRYQGTRENVRAEAARRMGDLSAAVQAIRAGLSTPRESPGPATSEPPPGPPQASSWSWRMDSERIAWMGVPLSVQRTCDVLAVSISAHGRLKPSPNPNSPALAGVIRRASFRFPIQVALSTVAGGTAVHLQGRRHWTYAGAPSSKVRYAFEQATRPIALDLGFPKALLPPTRSKWYYQR